jgi:hypothetical protein
MNFLSPEMMWAVGVIATGVIPNANAPPQPLASPTLLSRPAMAPSSHRTPEISQVDLSYRLTFVRGMKMADKPQDFFVGYMGAGRRFSRISRTIEQG